MAKFGADVTAISEVDTRGLTETTRPVDDRSFLAEGIESFGAIAKTLVQGKARAETREGLQALIDNRVEAAGGESTDEIIELRTELSESDDQERKAEISGEIKKLKKAKLQGVMSDTQFRAAAETYAKQQIQSSLGADAKLVHEVLNEEFARSKNVLALIDAQQQSAAEGNKIDEYLTKQALQLGMGTALSATTEEKAAYVSQKNLDTLKFTENTRSYTAGVRTTEEFLSESGGILQQKALLDTNSRIQAIQEIQDPGTRLAAFNTLQSEIEARHLNSIQDANGNTLNIAGKDHFILKNIKADIARNIDLAKGISDGTIKQAQLDSEMKWQESTLSQALLADPQYRVASVMRTQLGDNFVQLVQGGFPIRKVAEWSTQVARTLEYGETAFKDNKLSIPESWEAMHTFMRNVVRNPDLAPDDFQQVKDTMVKLIKRDDEFTGKEHIQYVDGIVDFFASDESELFLKKFQPQDRAELDSVLKGQMLDMLTLLRSEDAELTVAVQNGEIFATGTDPMGFNQKYANRFNQMNRALNHLQGAKDYQGAAETMEILINESQGLKKKFSDDETAQKNERVRQSFSALFSKIGSKVREALTEPDLLIPITEDK